MRVRCTMTRRRSAGFTFADLAAVLVIVVIVAAALLVIPMLGTRGHRTSTWMTNSVQLRGIHQGMVSYAQGNKSGNNDGYFPGLDRHGNVVPDGPDTGYSGDGTQPGARFWMMIEGNYFTPEYLISPADPPSVKYPVAALGDPVLPANYSYAVLGLAASRSADEKAEWSETLNTSAIVLSDRAIGTGRADERSIWGEYGSGSSYQGGPGDWRGTVVRNDNSTGFEVTAEFADTQYGKGTVNPLDHLFEDDAAADDAYLVHGNATTAYSPD